MKKFLMIIILSTLLCGCSNKNLNSIKSIDTETVFSSIDKEEIYIIDVRETYEYNDGHIKSAYNIPVSNIDEINKLNIHLNSKIIVYCQSGNRSKIAANKLLEMGYTNIYDMGGINKWNYELIKE